MSSITSPGLIARYQTAAAARPVAAFVAASRTNRARRTEGELVAAATRGAVEHAPLGAVRLCEGIDTTKRSHAVHHGMVHLEEARRPAALDPFDRISLPQRPHVIERHCWRTPPRRSPTQVTLGRQPKDRLGGMMVELEVRVVFPLRKPSREGASITRWRNRGRRATHRSTAARRRS